MSNAHDMCSLASSEVIMKDICLVYEDDELVYAGPINDAPFCKNRFIVLNPSDYKEFENFMKKAR